MEKLAIIREDITPTEEKNGDLKFQCDNKKTGEAALVKKAQEKLDQEQE